MHKKELPLKDLILQILKKKHLVSAPQLLAELENNGKTYNKTSIYRALEQLLESNVICRHHFSQAEASYELRNEHHTHLVCTSCGSIQTADCTYNHTSKIKNFRVTHHHLTLFGVCSYCRSKY